MSNSFITRRSSSTTKTITFDGYTGNLTPEVGTDGVSKWLNAPDLSVARYSLAATHVGNYALFAGGRKNSNYSNVVDAYNTSLEKSTPTPLSQTRYNLVATHIGDYALFGGGYSDSTSTSVFAYNTSLEQVTPSPQDFDSSVGYLAATHVGDYALFGGGNSMGTKQTVVYAYNTSLEQPTPTPYPTPLSVARENLAATHVGNYALFGGGLSGTVLDVVDAYNPSLERTTPTPLSQARSYLAATNAVDYALFAGGQSNYGYSNVVDAYNTSLERSTPTILSQARYGLKATHIGQYGIFGGGGDTDNDVFGEVDVYNKNLELSNPIPLMFENATAATHIGDYALFSSSDGKVEVYTTPAQTAKITLPPNVSYEFGSLSGTTTQPTEISPNYPLYGTVTVS